MPSDTADQTEWTAAVAEGPADRLDFDSVDALTEVTHPMRGRLLSRFRHPATAAEAAAALDVPVTRLYHHIKRLEAAGIIRVVATRRVGSATERRYQVAALSFGPGPELLASGTAAEFAAGFGSVFDFAKLGFQRELEVNGRDALDKDGSILSLAHVTVTEEQRADLVKRLAAVVEELLSESEQREQDDSADEPTERMAVFVAVYPST